jgi:hypothetical protein
MITRPPHGLALVSLDKPGSLRIRKDPMALEQRLFQRSSPSRGLSLSKDLLNGVEASPIEHPIRFPVPMKPLEAVIIPFPEPFKQEIKVSNSLSFPGSQPERVVLLLESFVQTRPTQENLASNSIFLAGIF